MKVAFWNETTQEEDVVNNVHHVNFYRDHVRLYFFKTHEEKKIPIHLVLSVDSELFDENIRD